VMDGRVGTCTPYASLCVVECIVVWDLVSDFSSMSSVVSDLFLKSNARSCFHFNLCSQPSCESVMMFLNHQSKHVHVEYL
jgi:hypothetical protein